MRTPSGYFFRLGFRLPEYLRVLPNVFDRCEASRYFLIQATEDPHSKRAVWYARTSLNEFKSAITLIPVDIKVIGLKTEWVKSSYKKELERDLIIRMVNVCRNLSFHVASVTSMPKESMVRIIGPDESHVSTQKTLFVDGMKKQSQNRRLNLSLGELREISEIEDNIPLYMILAECYATTSICLENFLIEYRKVDFEDSEKFWNR